MFARGRVAHSSRRRVVVYESIIRVAMILASFCGAPVCGARAAEYTLMPSPQTVHIGHFNAALKPVLTVNSGDIVTIETATHIDPAEIDRSGVVPPPLCRNTSVRSTERSRTAVPPLHILTGPIFVNGAMPGDVLELRILEIELAVPYGFNAQRPYTGALAEEFPRFFQRIIPINRQAKTAEIAQGVIIPLTRPFFGTMGVAPLPRHGAH
jgi:acetamidase/formamidase